MPQQLPQICNQILQQVRSTTSHAHCVNWKFFVMMGGCLTVGKNLTSLTGVWLTPISVSIRVVHCTAISASQGGAALEVSQRWCVLAPGRRSLNAQEFCDPFNQ